ncbi:MAG: hypothetical protein V7603_4452 [Micromonosporaceae bacterium]|jgi:hypothetical protein
MYDIDKLLDDVYGSQERVTRDVIHRRAVALDLPADVIAALDTLPEGEYAQDEVTEALAQLAGPGTATMGVPPAELTDADLCRELGHLHETRADTFRHGSAQALAHHDERTALLEDEYLRRFPDREVDPLRLRAGARGER